MSTPLSTTAPTKAAPTTTGIVSHPRWDGRRVMFEIADGPRTIPCTISMGALQDLSVQRQVKPAELLRCFTTARDKIATIALDKLRARPADATGLLFIWADDIDEPPPRSGAPAVARRSRAAAAASA